MGMLRALTVCFAAGLAAHATTLEKLSLNDMANKATEVVRAKVGTCSAAYRGRLIYTTCQLNVTEFWKGADRKAVTVSVPGGKVGAQSQNFAGAPALLPGKEHIFFLWTGPSGMTQLLGLSQGLLGLEQLPNGQWMALRVPGSARMLDASGRAVRDDGVDVPLIDIRRTVLLRSGK